jgi:hypothetical protein
MRFSSNKSRETEYHHPWGKLQLVEMAATSRRRHQTQQENETTKKCEDETSSKKLNRLDSFDSREQA